MKPNRYTLGLGCSLAFVACSPKGPYALSPQYRPTSHINLDVIPSSSATLVVQRVVDGRTDITRIGRSKETSPPRDILADQVKVISLVDDAFTRGLSEAGFQVARSGSVLLTITILALWVDEDNTYKASARFKVEVTREGIPQKGLIISGSASRWGSSASEENYNEVLSDSLVNALENLVKSPDFQSAVTP